MQFRLTYQEISDLIQKKTGKSLPILYGGPHTVRISYDVNVLFKSASVGIDLTVEQIAGSDITLSYSGGAGIDFMVKTALNHAKNQPGGELIEPLGDNRILLLLGKNAQAGTIFDHIVLKDIYFDEQFVIIDFEPKSI
ncbi:MAG: hypothetical protein II662_01990 [Bacteroidales bacterium]|nr:hypothetical protein [Bacteroidales bacterium]